MSEDIKIQRRTQKEGKKFNVEEVSKQLVEFNTGLNDKEIKKNIRALYHNYQDNRPTTIDEINSFIKNAYVHSSYFAFLIGDVLVSLEESIDKGKSSYKSINEYLDANFDKIGVSKKTAYAYRNIRKTFTFEQYLTLGYTNAVNAVKLKDEKKLTELMSWVEDNKDINTADTAQYIDNQMLGTKEELTRRKKKEISKIDKSIRIDNEVDGNKLTFIFQTEEEREIAEMYLREYIIRMKNYIAKELKARG